MNILPLRQPVATSPPEAEALLTADKLRKTFRRRAVVQDVSFSVKKGEAAGLLGPNGAGKTTVFYMLAGLIRPDAGRVWLHGQDITRFPVWQRARAGLNYLPQEPSIFRGMSVADNIMSVLEVTEVSRASAAERLEALLAEFMLTHLRDVAGAALSGGERRRVEIARTLACRPEVILLDEPFVGIDPIALDDIYELVAHLKDRGIGVLITDHNVRETLNLVDHALVLNNGRVIARGKPQEIVGNEEVKRVYLGERFIWHEREGA